MYASLEEWMNVPVVINPCIEVDSAGDKVYGPGINTTCYSEEKVTKVVDSRGIEVLSSTVLYFRGTETIKTDDTVNYNGANKRPIKAISSFIEDGLVRSIWVVYL